MRKLEQSMRMSENSEEPENEADVGTEVMQEILHTLNDQSDLNIISERSQQQESTDHKPARLRFSNRPKPLVNDKMR